MRFKLIVATTQDNGIGYNNTLPWKIKDELKHFAKTTIGNKKNIVLMGKNTWESIPNRPLKNRLNVIISSTLHQQSDPNSSTHIYNSISSFLKNTKQYQEYEECWIIGGERIYNNFLNEYIDLLDELHITRISNNYVCDTFFQFPAVKTTLKSTEISTCYDATIDDNVEIIKQVYSLK